MQENKTVQVVGHLHVLLNQGVFLDRLLDGGLIAVCPLHLGSSVVTGCLCSTAGTALTVKLHQFAHCNRRQVAFNSDQS